MATAPLTLEEARDSLRSELSRGFATPLTNLRYEDAEGVLAALLVKHAHCAADGQEEAEKITRRLFELIGSARINLKSVQAVLQLQLHGREAFMGSQVDWEGAIELLIRGADDDLRLAQDHDISVPF